MSNPASIASGAPSFSGGNAGPSSSGDNYASMNQPLTVGSSSEFNINQLLTNVILVVGILWAVKRVR